MASPELLLKNALGLRNAMREWDHVGSRVAAAGTDDPKPLVTIAIPTFRRFDLLVEAVESALRQRFDRKFEILVVDNDPGSHDAERLIELLPGLKNANFRYFVNNENIRMYPNHNRCIQLARGEWVTILHDDDLVDEDFLATMFSTLDADARIKGLACCKRTADQRKEGRLVPHSFPRRIAARLLLEGYFSGRATRAVGARKLFWGPVLGNLTGFIFRRDAANQIGGFYPEDDMSADYWFYVRYAKHFGVHQHRHVGATIRLAENESANAETLMSFFQQSYRMQQALAGNGVPRWWRHLSPLMIGRQVGGYRTYWHIDFPKHQVEEKVGARVTDDHPILYRAIRLVLRGF